MAPVTGFSKPYPSAKWAGFGRWYTYLMGCETSNRPCSQHMVT